MDSTRLGDLAISYELIDEEQLERCLELQETHSPPRYLGEILVAEGHLNERTLRRLLSAQHKELERSGSGEGLQRKQLAERLAPGASLRVFLEILGEFAGQELHLAVGARPTARVNGTLRPLRPEPLSLQEMERLLSELLNEEEQAIFEREQSLKLVYSQEDLGRFRASVFQQRLGPAALLCRISLELPTLDGLGLPSVVREVRRMRRGLVLVTGPRASGKTTTLAALVELINSERRHHVVCLDETVEFVHESRRSLVTQVKVGKDVTDWDRALHSTLRLDPDVIVAGDLDSPGRLATALRAAETGHLVLGTLPTRGAEQTLLAVIRGCDVERRNQVCSSLADLLRLVVSQELIPGQEGECLHLACEVLRCTPAVANMIREQRFHQLGNVIQTSREEGMLGMDESLFRLVSANKISAGDALARAKDPERLLARVRATGGKL
jgi:twitching motility protein PilT